MMSENNELVPIDNSIQWCLLSHTNIGKTTLTRTLMADDVGEIDDAAHVTTQSQRYLLQKTQQGDELWLWDTPVSATPCGFMSACGSRAIRWAGFSAMSGTAGATSLFT
jgi:hypothetical protein